MPEENQPEDTALGTQSAALEVGLRVLRQYVLKRFLGRGSLGSAWLVVHEGIGRQLTMRFLPESWLHNEVVIERLREAVVRLLEITHPGIVGILDFVRDPQTAAIVSRFVEGESAVDAKAQNPQRCFEVDKLRPWLTQLCEALDFAWRRSEAIHGDLCPANLLITPLGDLKVSDFGLARSLYDLKSPTGDPLLVMPPVFSSPERLRGEPATVADDVFGFGASVFDLITSKPPFAQGSTGTEVPPSMAERRAALGIGGELIPTEWEEVIAACLAPVAADRPRSLREVGERLRVLAPLPEGADRPPQPTVLPRPHETVTGYRPPSTRPAVIYPSSEVTAAMEPPTMHGDEASAAAPTEPLHESPPASAEVPPPLAAPAPIATTPAPAPDPEPAQESAPATIDETFDFEETMAEPPPPPTTTAPAAATIAPNDDDASATFVADLAPPPPPTAAPSPFVPPPPTQSQPAPDDASATIAADPPPPPAPVPATEPGPAMVEEDYEKTVAEVRPPPPVAPPPMPAVAPPPPADIPKNLEDSVTMPAAKRPAYTPAPPPMPAPREVPAPASVPAAPAPAPSRGIPPWIFAVGGVVLLAAVAAPFALRQGDPEPTPAPADPTPIAVVATPELSTPPPVPATPDPIPAPPTPAPTPPPMAGRLVQAEELITSAPDGRVTESWLLSGSFRVSSVVPPRPGEGANVVMRPADEANSGKMRVLVKLAPSTPAPAEGSTLTLDAASGYFIREIRHGADGQVNVQIEQR